jgi:transcriptional regulator with XRE-family HTH domain
MDLGSKLRTFAEKEYGSFKAFAQALGIKQPNLTAYLNNKNMPGGDMLMKLHKLGCDINWLLSETEEEMNLVKEPGAAYGGEESDWEKIRRLEAEVKELRKKLGMIQKITGEEVRD